MSFVISNTQYLAPMEDKAQYEPLVFKDEELKIENIEVAFGHPLYTAVSDIFYMESLCPERKYVPIIPDGCMTLVFHSKGENTGAYICGTVDEIKKMCVGPDDHYVFMRFLPGTGYSLLDDSANKATNRALEVRAHMKGGEQILSILGRETLLVERLRLISKVIRIYLKDESDKYLVKYCTKKIFHTQGNIKIENLAEETGFTPRYIGKIFERCVGVSPKLYAQILRLQFSMKKIMDEQERLLVDIACDSGFFDHAHMNRTYNKFLHCSSGEFKKYMFSRLDYEKIGDYISVS